MKFGLAGTCWLQLAIWQAVKLTFFAPWGNEEKSILASDMFMANES